MINSNGVSSKLYADTAQWSPPSKPLLSLPSPNLKLGLAAPRSPLSIAQIQDLKWYLNFVPQDKQAFLSNIAAGGLGFIDTRPLWIDGPAPKEIPESTNREMIVPPPPQLPPRVTAYEFDHDKDSKQLILQQVLTNGIRRIVTLAEALQEPSGNLQILQKAHPKNWRDFELLNTPRTKENQRQKRKREDPEFVYDQQ